MLNVSKSLTERNQKPTDQANGLAKKYQHKRPLGECTVHGRPQLHVFSKTYIDIGVSQAVSGAALANHDE